MKSETVTWSTNINIVIDVTIGSNFTEEMFIQLAQTSGLDPDVVCDDDDDL